MAKRKITVTVDEELVESAKLASESLSAVVNQALAAELDRRARAAALAGLLAGWEAEHGPVDEQSRLMAQRAFDDLDGVVVTGGHGRGEQADVA
jgi:post-segregation antitoxin (ccd killing protein)